MYKNQWRELLKKKIFDNQNTSKKICQNIKSFSLYKQAKNIALFYPLKTEIDLRSLKNDSQNFFLPRYKQQADDYELALWDETPLEKKHFNIFEPKQEQQIATKLDIIFIPALGFDKNFQRIGYGKGFYDRIILQYPHALKIGVQNQTRIIQDNFPIDSWDKKMDIIISDKKIISSS